MHGTSNGNRLSTRTKPRGRLLVVAVVVTLAALAASASAAAVRIGGPLVPRSGALMGAYVNPSNQHDLTLGEQQKLVRDFEALIGRKLDIDMNYYGWGAAFWRRIPAWDLTGG